MQMWHLPAIFAPDFLLTFFGNSKFMPIHFFCSSHFRWYWRIYTLIPKKKLFLPVVSRTSGVYREFWAKIMEITIRKLTVHLTLGRTRKVIPPPWYKGGGGGWWNPPLGFLICCNISKRFCVHWKAFDILYKLRYILWVVALLEGLWRHQTWSSSWSPSWILSRVRNEVKTMRINNFLCLTC